MRRHKTWLGKGGWGVTRQDGVECRLVLVNGLSGDYREIEGKAEAVVYCVGYNTYLDNRAGGPYDGGGMGMRS